MTMPAGRLPLGDVRARCPFVSAVAGFASKYNSVTGPAATLFKSATASLGEGNTKACQDSAEKASKLFLDAGDQAGHVDAILLLISAAAASSSSQGGLPTEALATAEDHKKSFMKSGDKRGEACMKLAAAELASFTVSGSTSFEEALEGAGEAMSTFQDLDDKAMEACAQLVLSGLNYKRQRATDCHQAATAALKLFQELGNKACEARAYQALALSYLIPDDFENAMKSSRKAVALYKELGMKRHQSLELQSMAQSYLLQEKPQKAVKAAKDALAVAAEVPGNGKNQALLLWLLAEALVADGHDKRALKTVQDGLAKLREDGDVQGIVGGLQALLHTFLLLHSPGEALEAALDAKSHVSSIDGEARKYAEIDLLHSKSKALLGQGETDLATDALREAAGIAKQLGDSQEEAAALKAVALAYASDPSMRDMAQNFVSEARSLCQSVGDTLGEASAVMLSGSLLVKSGASADEVLGEVEEARALYQEAEDIIGEAAALKVMVDCCVAKQDYADAMEAASDGMELYKQLGRKKAQAEAMCSVANIHVQLGDTEEAMESIEEASALAQEVGAKALEARLQLLLAQVYVTAMSREELPADKRAALPPSFLEARTNATKATKTALELAGKSGDKNIRASALFWRAEVLFWAFRGGEAILSAQEAEEQFAQCNDVRGQAHSKVLMANLNLMMGAKDAAQELAGEVAKLIEGVPGMEDVQASANVVIEKASKKDVAPIVAVGPAVEAQLAVSIAVKAPALSKETVRAKILELASASVADGEAVEQDVPFMEAGIDSLGSVQFVTDVSREFAMQLPPSAIFDYPTGRALIDHILEESAN